MSNVIKAILEAAKDRLKNPLSGAFVFAWIAFNWKPVFVLFSISDSVHLRIDVIEECYSSVYQNFIYPVIFAFAYVLFMPYFLLLIDFIINFAIKHRKKNQLNLKGSTLDLEHENVEKELKLENKKAKHQTLLELNNKINDLEHSNEEKDVTITKLDLNNKALSSKLKENSSGVKGGGKMKLEASVSKKLSHTELLVKKIVKDAKHEEYITFATNIAKGHAFDLGSVYVNYYMELGLLEIKHKVSGGTVFNLNESGNLVLNRLRIIKLGG